jgi:hypothetical protein
MHSSRQSTAVGKAHQAGKRVKQHSTAASMHSSRQSTEATMHSSLHSTAEGNAQLIAAKHGSQQSSTSGSKARQSTKHRSQQPNTSVSAARTAQCTSAAYPQCVLHLSCITCAQDCTAHCVQCTLDMLNRCPIAHDICKACAACIVMHSR